MYKVKSTEYTVSSKVFLKPLKFALISDLHSRANTDISVIVELIRKQCPDIILAAGDIFERLDGSLPKSKEAGFELLKICSDIAPTFYSFGNHENGGTRSWDRSKWKKIKSLPKSYDEGELAKIRACGVTLLDDAYVLFDGIAFGGLSSGLINEGRMPDISWLDAFCNESAPKVLLCHHPEYYKKYLVDKNIDLIASGHAHGGQWRIFGRGVFAPGQGIFPRYTSGVHHGKFVISKGLKPSGKIPRIFNPPEVVFINIKITKGAVAGA